MFMSIQPLFVFDGPKKPPFKRNKATGPNCMTLEDRMVIQLLKLFGFPSHNAPGEAEAECALLQREGIVDAVLSEDVDTIMFGCGMTLRNWSSEGPRGSPTHVSVYDASTTTQGFSGLDREGMVLIALMSGGDYITEGIPGCGMKLACEAARAGFGKSLCKLSRTDNEGIRSWRKGLSHQIQKNEKKYFRVKHTTLKIPDTFPNMEVLGYYTHPVVSTVTEIAKLKEGINWDGDVDILGLRAFVADAFGWSHQMGTQKLIRGIAPALLVSKLRSCGKSRSPDFNDFATQNKMELVNSICGRRTQFSTDGILELRLTYNPTKVVGLDLSADEGESDRYTEEQLNGLGDNEDEELYRSGDNRSSRTKSASPTRKKPYDPNEPKKVWVPEVIARMGVPHMVDDYEKSQQNPKKVTKAKHQARRPTSKSGMPSRAMDRYVMVTKPNMTARSLQGSEVSKRAMQDRNLTLDTTREAAQKVDKKRGEVKRFLILRDSLEGAWKEVYEDELLSGPGSRGRAWRLSEVEVLDMTCHES
jgi:Holliday junction resolvase YEN1